MGSEARVEAMAPLVFRAARRKLLVLLLGSLAFVASGVFILVTGRGVGPTLTGLAGIAFFGMCAVVAIVQLFDARPRLVIDERGVLDRTLKVGIIAWADILDAEAMRVSNQPFIARKLRDPAKHVERLGPMHQRFTTSNRALGYGPLNINLSAIETGVETLAALIVREAELRREPPRGPYRG